MRIIRGRSAATGGRRISLAGCGANRRARDRDDKGPGDGPEDHRRGRLMKLTVYNRFNFQLETRHFGDDSELLLVQAQLFTRSGAGWMATREEVLIPLAEFGFPKGDTHAERTAHDPGRSRPLPAAADQEPLARPLASALRDRRAEEPPAAEEVTTVVSHAARPSPVEKSSAAERVGESLSGLPTRLDPA